ncbi:MAG: DUF6383 domain-containing protein [Parabacteroides sp.]|nr:DUF6383 domain-containing protein [Parabacteroides sp.]
MNKKFSALVAALLASGGLFYAVDAMILPAGDGVAKTFVGAVAQRSAGETITGYTLSAAAFAADACTWSLEKNGEKWLLKAGEGFYLNDQLEVQEGKAGIAGFTIAEGVISGLFINNGELSTTGNTPAGLFLTTGEIAGTTNGTYVLGPVAYGDAALVPLDNSSLGLKLVAASKATVQAAVFGTGGSVSPVFTVEAGEGEDVSLYLKLGDGAYLLSDGTDLSIGPKPTQATASSVISIEGSTNKVKIGEKWLVNTTGELSLGNATANGNVYASTLAVAVDGTPTKAATVTDANSIALFTLENTEIAATDYKVTFTPAVLASNTMVSLGNVSGTDFENVDETQKFVLDGGALKLGAKFVTFDGNGILLGATANNFTLQNDGSLAYGANKLAVDELGNVVTTGGEPLYLYNAVNTIETNNESSASAFVVSKKVMGKAPVTNLTDEMVTTVTAKILDSSKPGADVPGMEDITVSDDGEITITEPVSNIPAPHAIVTATGTLSVNSKGEVVYLSGTDAANSTSWILKDGKYMSVEQSKLGKANIWLAIATNLASVSKSATTTSYILVADKAKGLDAKATATGIELAGSAINATLTTTGTAVPVSVTLEKESWLTSNVSDGKTVVLGNGTSAFISDENGNVTANINNAALWVISMNVRGDGNYNYTFKLKDTDKYLTVGGAKDFVAEKYEGTFALKTADGKYLSIPGSGSASLTNGSTSSVLYGVPVAVQPFTAEEILTDHGTLISFNLSLWDEKDGVSELVQNPFADADLVPVYYNSGTKTFTPITADNAVILGNPSTFLLKKGNSYIVVETTKDSEWSNINTELVKGGYKFVTLSEKAMTDVMQTGKWKDGSYAPYFTFNYDQNSVENGEATANTPIYTISVSDKDKANASNVSTFTIKTGAQAGTYLTTSSEPSYWVYAEFSANNAVRGDSDKDYNPLNMKYVNITFVNHPSITWNNIKLNGKVLGAAGKPADADNFLFSKPEGQWAVQMTAATAAIAKGESLDNVYGFTFVNRENNTEKYKVSKMYYLGNNKYAVAYDNGQAEFATGDVALLRDTIAITPVEGLKNDRIQRDGYKNLTAEEVQDQLFNLLVASTEEDYYVGENHTAKSHFLGLSHNADAAVNWRIVPLTAARAYDANKDLTQASDSVYVFNHPQYYKASDKKFYQYNDTLAIIGYALQNAANDEFLTYENPQTTDILSMICNPNFKLYKTTKNISEAYRFVLKEKGTDLYNIIGVDYPTYDNEGFVNKAYIDRPYAKLNLENKLYGATTLTKQGAVEVEDAYAQINSNDLFKVQMVGAPEYRLQSMGDTIRIFRQENEYDQMFEKGEFLNIGNKAQLTDMAPALYVDTAYVNRGNNNRYQYLLVVNPEYKAATFDNANHQLTPDTTYGRFLVNLVDTANVAYQNGAIHANKYINDTEAGEPYAKLGFVYGFRTADKLYITDKNYKKSAKASDVIDLGISNFNTAKFAFRYIDPINHESDGSFKIQTGYYDYDSYIAKNKQPEVANNGYLKNINGVVVVAQGYEAGDKFDLAAEHSNPTANEGIDAASFSVATIDGAVVVKGAEGKTVTITNVLGQTVANTVITSSEATIAVPAGVVVVAVEGEAAVKAIVK